MANLKILEAKEKILQRTWELFRIMGMRSLTMDFIASDLGMSKRTLYEMFNDKDTLILKTIEYMILKNNIRLLDIIRKKENVIEAIFVIVEDLHEQMNSANQVILEDLQRYFVRLKTSYYANREKCREFSVTYHLLDKGIREGVFRKNLKLDLIDIFIQELIIMMHSSDALKLTNITREDAISNILLPYFRGLCTSYGLQLVDSFSDQNV